MIRHLVIICLLALAAGCASQPTGGGWKGPLVDPDGNPILPPTYEQVAP